MKYISCISWDEYFMGVAEISAKRSKDPNTKVGACIANEENKIVGIGYNGFPTGGNDYKDFPWERNGEWLDTKYPYILHAEINSVLNSYTNNLKNCRIYCTLMPCNECAKVIIQVGIKKVIYKDNKYPDDDKTKAALKLFKERNIEVIKYERMEL